MTEQVVEAKMGRDAKGGSAGSLRRRDAKGGGSAGSLPRRDAKGKGSAGTLATSASSDRRFGGARGSVPPRALPGYALGDRLREEDAAAAASPSLFEGASASDLRLGDRVFLRRSDGSHTYALFEGRAGTGPRGDDLLSFRLDDRGHFKLVAARHLATRVKVPALPPPDHEKDDHFYPASVDDDDDDDDDDDIDSAKKPARPKLANYCSESQRLFENDPVASGKSADDVQQVTALTSESSKLLKLHMKAAGRAFAARKSDGALGEDERGEDAREGGVGEVRSASADAVHQAKALASESSKLLKLHMKATGRDFELTRDNEAVGDETAKVGNVEDADESGSDEDSWLDPLERLVEAKIRAKKLRRAASVGDFLSESQRLFEEDRDRQNVGSTRQKAPPLNDPKDRGVNGISVASADNIQQVKTLTSESSKLLKLHMKTTGKTFALGRSDEAVGILRDAEEEGRFKTKTLRRTASVGRGLDDFLSESQRLFRDDPARQQMQPPDDPKRTFGSPDEDIRQVNALAPETSRLLKLHMKATGKAFASRRSDEAIENSGVEEEDGKFKAKMLRRTASVGHGINHFLSESQRLFQDGHATKSRREDPREMSSRTVAAGGEVGDTRNSSPDEDIRQVNALAPETSRLLKLHTKAAGKAFASRRSDEAVENSGVEEEEGKFEAKTLRRTASVGRGINHFLSESQRLFQDGHATKSRRKDPREMSSRTVAAGGGVGDVRIKSADDVQRVKTLAAPESSKLLRLHMKATGRNFALTRNAGVYGDSCDDEEGRKYEPVGRSGDEEDEGIEMEESDADIDDDDDDEYHDADNQKKFERPSLGSFRSESQRLFDDGDGGANGEDANENHVRIDETNKSLSSNSSVPFGVVTVEGGARGSRPSSEGDLQQVKTLSAESSKLLKLHMKATGRDFSFSKNGDGGESEDQKKGGTSEQAGPSPPLPASESNILMDMMANKGPTLGRTATHGVNSQDILSRMVTAGAVNTRNIRVASMQDFQQARGVVPREGSVQQARTLAPESSKLLKLHTKSAGQAFTLNGSNEGTRGDGKDGSEILRRAATVGHGLNAGFARQASPLVSQYPKPNILSDMLARSRQGNPQGGLAGTPRRTKADSEDILSRMVTATGAAGSGNIRVASMQDFQRMRRKTTLDAVPESSRLRTKAPGQAPPAVETSVVPAPSQMIDPKLLKLHGRAMARNAASVPSNMAAAHLMKRRATTDQHGSMMPGIPGNGANASWEAAGLAAGKAAGNQVNSKHIMSHDVTAKVGANNLRTASSMQDFQRIRRTTTNTMLNTIPECSGVSKLRRNAVSQEFKLAKSRHGADIKDGTDAARMPRNVTLRRLDAAGVDRDATAGGANASWEPARNATGSTDNENPLLASLALLETPSVRPASHSPAVAGGTDPPPGVEAEYSVGDRIPKECMPPASMSEMKMALLVSKLKVDDTAFVKRSGGYYSYSRVSHKDLASITFTVSKKGNIKTFDLLGAGKYVRIVEGAEVLGSGAERATKQTNEDSADDRSDGETSDPPSSRGAAALRRRGTADGVRHEPDRAAPRRRRTTVDESNTPYAISDGDVAGSDDAPSRRRTTVERAGAPGSPRGTGDSPRGAPAPAAPSGRSTIRPPSPSAEREGRAHEAGARVGYKQGPDDLMRARILEVHYDDGPLEPYYTILLEDGREKQTDGDRIITLGQ